MARIGMKHLVYAPISAEGSNSITYGTGVLAEHARRGAVTYNWAEGSLYGDDLLAEYAKECRGADIEVEMTELDAAVAVLLGLEKVKSGSGATAVYTMKSENQVRVGFGFIQTQVVNGTKLYRAFWFHKVSFTPGNEESATKEDTIAWGSPTISGKCWTVDLDDSGEPQVRDFKDFTTEAAAAAWLDGLANVPST